MIIKNYKFLIKPAGKPGIAITIPLFNFSQQKIKINPQGLYYEKLGIPQNAHLHHIKRSYYQLSKKFHPDIYKGDLSQFHAIKQAYEILTNQQLRQQYDSLIKKASNKEQNKEQQKSQEEEEQNPGPYQTEQEYQKYSKGYYNLNSLQWNNKRRGMRQQSFISSESFMYRNMGATNDDQISHYDRKLSSEKRRELDQDKIQSEEQDRKVRELSQKLQELHRDRLNSAIQEHTKQKRETLQKSWIGNLIVKIWDKLKRRRNQKDM